jgi:hypothetical protein
MTSVLVSGEDLRKYYSTYRGWIEPNQTILDLGVPNTEKNGSNCDGDSGSGFFVQKGNVRYYLGAAGGSQAGITNCRSFLKFPPTGGMSGVNPTHKFLALIKEAEDFVANEKKLEAIQEAARVAAELKAKQDADERVRVEAELKAKLEVEAKAAAELKAKQDAEAKVAAELKAKLEAEAKIASLKKTTITCIKGKLIKKVTALKPKCPTGYKLKK